MPFHRFLQAHHFGLVFGAAHLFLQRLEHAHGRLRVLRGDVAVHHRVREGCMLAEQVAKAVAGRRIELDRAMAAHRPDALQHQLGGPKAAAARPLDGGAHQLVRHLAARVVELDRRGADGIARPAGPARMALGKAAVGMTKIRSV